jgi:hypothetical protein
VSGLLSAHLGPMESSRHPEEEGPERVFLPVPAQRGIGRISPLPLARRRPVRFSPTPNKGRDKSVRRAPCLRSEVLSYSPPASFFPVTPFRFPGSVNRSVVAVRCVHRSGSPLRFAAANYFGTTMRNSGLCCSLFFSLGSGICGKRPPLWPLSFSLKHGRGLCGS